MRPFGDFGLFHSMDKNVAFLSINFITMSVTSGNFSIVVIFNSDNNQLRKIRFVN